MTRRRNLLTVLCLLLAVLVLPACGETPGDVLPDPRDGRSGLQMSGRVGDRPIAVSDGLPDVNFGDCDVAEGNDRDLCVVTEDISGELVVLIFENPDVLVEGERLPIDDAACEARRDCDEVTDVAIVDVAVGSATDRVRAVSGQVTIEVAVPLSRYRGSFDLRLPEGTLTGTFDLIPRPDELSWREAPSAAPARGTRVWAAGSRGQ